MLQSYIDFEINQGQRARTRALYERLLDRTRHVKVWVSFAEFEAAALPQPETEEGAPQQNGKQLADSQETPAAREAHARRQAVCLQIAGHWLLMRVAMADSDCKF